MTATSAPIRAVLDELAARPPDEWPALLRARYPGDPGLARQLLLWLHASRAQAAGPGEPDGAGDPDLHEAAPDDPAERPGALGASTRYELGVRLDDGATASVWRAYDRKLRRNVAIKVFRAGSSLAMSEILAEARAAAELTSGHVVRVLDVHDAEPPYIVMELVGEHEPRTGALQPGASAATCRPRDLWEAVRWVRDVARGVHDAHLRNVFHRDLKPHNVLITPISRCAKVADFGLAVSGAGPDAAGVRAGMVVELGADRVALRIAGTPGYMAPEQARGLPVALDPRVPADRATLAGVDLWGLGAIAYDLLSGHPPWRAEPGLDAWEVAAGDARPAPLERTPRGERIPLRLRRIVERALASAPEHRYSSAGELADELHAVLTCRPTSFDRSPARRLALWSRRNPQLTITAVVAVALAAMSLATYATVLHLRDQRASLSAEVREAEADEARLAGQARTARGELADTEAALRTQSASLRALQQSLAEAEADYHAILEAKELATRALATVRGDRDIAEKARDLYETFWTRARKDADDAARERDKAARERDAARTAADQATKERDEARAARSRAEHDRDAARAERDRNAAARRQAEADVARLLGELSAMMASDGAGSAAARDRVEPSEPTNKGAVQ